MLQNIIKQVRDRGMSTAIQYAHYRLEQPFDIWRLGIKTAMAETGRHVRMSELDYGKLPDFRMYEPSPSYFVFKRVIRRFCDPSAGGCFLDLGSGLGRIALMAATFPFSKVIALEYSPELSVLAKEIITPVLDRLPCKSVEFATGDAASYCVPDDVRLVYFFNSFGGETLERTMDRFRESLDRRPRRIIFVCYYPDEFERISCNFPWIQKTADAEYPAVYSHRYAIFQAS